MRLHVEERYASDSDARTKYVEKKVEVLSRYFDRISKLDVILEVEGPAQRVQMMGYLVNHKVVKAKVETADMFASIDQAVDNMQRQLVRYKERLRVSRKTSSAPSSGGGRRVVARPPIEIVDDYPRQPLTPEEAIRALERGGREFLVFFQVEDDQPAVLFSRGDGSYGLVIPRR